MIVLIGAVAGIAAVSAAYAAYEQARAQQDYDRVATAPVKADVARLIPAPFRCRFCGTTAALPDGRTNCPNCGAA